MLLQKKPREPHFIAGLLDIFRILLSILFHSEFPVQSWLGMALYCCLLGGAIEKCHRKPLNLFSNNHSVFYAFVNAIAPCLHVKGQIYKKSLRRPI